eukprot:scaffold123500_cov19-Prasinocladus_malaysianus.AAC.1
MAMGLTISPIPISKKILWRSALRSLLLLASSMSKAYPKIFSSAHAGTQELATFRKFTYEYYRHNNLVQVRVRKYRYSYVQLLCFLPVPRMNNANNSLIQPADNRCSLALHYGYP